MKVGLVAGGGLFLLLLAGCATPKVDQQLKLFSASLDAAEKPLKPKLKKKALAEVKVWRDKNIQQGKTVYKPAEACDRIATGDLSGNPADCKLQRNFKVPEIVNSATYDLNAWNALRSYEKALKRLASSSAPGDINKGLKGLLSASNALKQAAEGSDSVFVLSKVDASAVTSLGGNLAEAARGRAIRKAVNQAHEPIELIIATLIEREERDDQLSAAFLRLDKKFEDLNRQRQSGTPASHRRAADAYEAEMQSFRQRYKKSGTARLMLVWKAQVLLFETVNKTGDLKLISAVLADIATLTE